MPRYLCFAYLINSSRATKRLHLFVILVISTWRSWFECCLHGLLCDHLIIHIRKGCRLQAHVPYRIDFVRWELSGCLGIERVKASAATSLVGVLIEWSLLILTLLSIQVAWFSSHTIYLFDFREIVPFDTRFSWGISLNVSLILSLLIKGHPIDSLAFWEAGYIAGLGCGTEAGEHVHWWGYLYVILMVDKPFGPFTQFFEALHDFLRQIAGISILAAPNSRHSFHLRPDNFSHTLNWIWSSLVSGQGRLRVLPEIWCLLEPTSIREVIFAPVQLTIRRRWNHEILFSTSALIFGVVHIYFCAWGYTWTAWWHLLRTV